MKTLRTAVVGLGRIGWQVHLPEIRKNDKYDLRAVVDVNEERLREAEQEYKVKGYTDLAAMLEAEELDLIVIASPTHLHRAQCEICFEHGVDVFLDKPMAPTLEDSIKIAEAAKKHGRKIMVYQPHRAVPAVTVLRRIIDEGKIGPVYMMKRAQSSYIRRHDWQSLRKFGGGMINNYGAHFIDQMIYLAREDVEDIFCVSHHIATLGDAEDVVKAVLKMKSGITIDIDINNATAHMITPWMVFGKYGTIVADGDSYSQTDNFIVKYYDPADMPEVTLDESLSAEGRRYNNDVPVPWKTEIVPVKPEDAVIFYDKCYEYFVLDKEPFVPVEETLRVMELLEEAHRKAD
ncbi:MAG: Gfo/Idh/MocA family oxidoreductase [Clostridia bacterium]|nr:Gfo/Idh/MocA family oxidoreductase [Clostridia bacterium]